MKKLTWSIALAAAVALLGRGRAAAAAQPPATRSSAQDQHFANAAAMSGLAETVLARLALGRARADAVKELARRVLDDHSEANRRLADISQEHNIALPAAPDAQHEMRAQQMAMLEGAAFDRAFVQALIGGHEEDIALYREEADNGTIMALREFAQATVPVLERHLELARKAAGSLD